MVNTQSITFGRFNLPHPGHINLIQRMLNVADRAYVALSGAATNNTFQLRLEAMKRLAEIQELEMQRICFFQSAGPYDAVFECINSGSDYVDVEKQSATTVVLGVDQSKLGERLRDDLGVKFVPNEVRIGSSTVIRYFLEIGNDDFVREIYYNDPLLFLIVQELRREELAREKSAISDRSRASIT